MKRRLHFCGIGGVGMSAVAEAALHCGYTVSGSDRRRDSGRTTQEDLFAKSKDCSYGRSVPDVLELLADSGATLYPQDGSGISEDCEAVVVSTAIEHDNPDLAAARRAGIAVWHRAECLARLMGKTAAVAVTGTSGKSTVTGMLGCIAEAAGLDPVVVNGAPVLNWMDNKSSGSVRHGSGSLWIFEADESDRSLLNFHPEWAAITNISTDHFSHEEAAALFDKFSRQVTSGVVWPDCSEDKYALEDEAAWSPLVRWQEMEFRLRVPGRHNAANAVTAARTARMMGLADDAIVRGLQSFAGIARRLELVGECGGVTVVDDYAHNPAKIDASLRTMLAMAQKNLRVIWRPHGYGPLLLMLKELAEVFAGTMRAGDQLVLLPVYDAGGTADRSINSGHLAAAIMALGGKSQMAVDCSMAVDLVLREAATGDLIMTMGARDPGLPGLARRFLDAGDRVTRLQSCKVTRDRGDTGCGGMMLAPNP